MKRIDTTAQQAKVLRAGAKALVKAETNAALATARQLHRIFYGEINHGGELKPLVEAWGFESFRDYAEHELGLHGATARQYVRVHQELVAAPPSSIKNEPLPDSLTKLMMLSRVGRMEPSRLAQYCRDSMKMSCCSLEQKIEQEFFAKRGHKNVSFRMRRNSAHTLMVRLRRAMMQLNTGTYGETLLEVMSQWESKAKARPLKKAG